MHQRIKTICGKIKFLSGAQLKTIAILSMLADHVNKALIYPNLVSNDGLLAVLSDFFDIIGRIAFPLFCFLLVEGYFKTRNRMKCHIGSAFRYVYNRQFLQSELE